MRLLRTTVIESVCCLSLVVTTLFYRVYRFLLYDCAQATGRKEHNLHKNVVITWRQQKITSGMATMGQTKHIWPFSFSYISADLINSISGNRIMHKPNEKSTISTRILSSRGGHTNLLHGDCQVDHDTVDTYGHFLSAINIDLNYSTFGSRNTCETNKKRIFCTRVSSLLGGHKNSPLEKQ
jgi:hypothetical protein